MINEDIIGTLEEREAPEYFQIAAGVCGVGTARILIKELGGTTLSAPMVTSSRSLIGMYVSENTKEIPIKKIAGELGMNERAATKMFKAFKKP